MIFAVFEIIGADVRYLLVNGFRKIRGRANKKFEHFSGNGRGDIFDELNRDYSNGIVGLLAFGALLYIAYLLLN